MQPPYLKTGTFVALLIVSLSANSAAIPDAPVTAMEPGLEADDRLGGAMGWIDDRTLLVTAQIDSKSQFWERRVVRVDAKTGEMKELINPGAVICTNPTENVAGILVGSEASIYTGNSKEPKPELKLFSWTSIFGKLTPKMFGDGWNPYICKKTKPTDVKVPGSLVFYKEKDIRYLEAKDGFLRFSRGQSGEQQSVVLVKDEKPVATLQAKPNEIAPEPRYLPFRDGYLLSSGRFVMQGTMARSNEEHTTEYPLLTMTRSGTIKREYFRPLFENAGLTVDGETFPYARGTLIFVSDRPKYGGGIYLNQGGSIKRIWCTNGGNTYDRQCRAMSISMSPDGCYLALFSNGSDNLKAPYVYRPTLKVLPLCNY